MDESHSKEQIGTITVSMIIAIRFIAAILFLYTFSKDMKAWALSIFLIAVFTDALDGHVARRLGGASPFLGPYTDAASDFFLVLLTFTAFVIKGFYPFWILFIIVAMFAQFVLTSGVTRPTYDPLGKYYGVFLYCAIGVTLVLPYVIIYQAMLAVILGFTFASVISRAMFLLGISMKQALDPNRSRSWQKHGEELWKQSSGKTIFRTSMKRLKGSVGLSLTIWSFLFRDFLSDSSKQNSIKKKIAASKPGYANQGPSSSKSG